MPNSNGGAKPETVEGDFSAGLDLEETDALPPPKVVHALSQTQERNIMDYLESQFLDVTRNFKKRCARANPCSRYAPPKYSSN